MPDLRRFERVASCLVVIAAALSGCGDKLEAVQPTPSASTGALEEVEEIDAVPEPEPTFQPERAPPAPDQGVAPTRQARLCSRPHDVSTTPGKGSQTATATVTASKQFAQGLEVQIDELEAQAWTPELGVEFDGLDPAIKHTIQIFDTRTGRQIKRLSLDFTQRGSDDICLGFSSFYATWQLRVLRTGARCGPCVTR